MDSIAEQPSLRLELGSMEDLPTIFHCLHDVESTDCVTAIIGFLEHFCSSNQWHNYHLL